MLTKTALNRLTESVSDRIVHEVHLYNQKISEAITEESLLEQFLSKLNLKRNHEENVLFTINVFKEHYLPVFTELLCVLRSERKDETLKYPFPYQLKNIIRADIERLTTDLNEFDSDSLIVEQLFEKIYPMLVEAKYIHFESEKSEPVFDLNVPVEEDVDIIEEVFDPPYPASANVVFEDITEEGSYDEGDWE